MTTLDDKVHLTWEEIHTSIKSLASEILSTFSPDIVIAVSEGGWIPTRLIKNHMNGATFYSIGCKNYDENDNQLKEARITQGLENLDLQGKKILIMDEVADSGITMKKVTKYISELGPTEIKTAVVHKKARSVFTPDYISEDVGNKWIYYPWDLENKHYA